MAKVQMTASQQLEYDGKRLRAGDSFEATKRDADILVATKRARYATRMLTADTDYDTKDMQPRGNGSSSTLHLPKRDKGAYKRRGHA